MGKNANQIAALNDIRTGCLNYDQKEKMVRLIYYLYWVCLMSIVVSSIYLLALAFGKQTFSIYLLLFGFFGGGYFALLINRKHKRLLIENQTLLNDVYAALYNYTPNNKVNYKKIQNLASDKSLLIQDVLAWVEDEKKIENNLDYADKFIARDF